MDLGEALVAILLFSVAGLVAAQWQGRRRRAEQRGSTGIGATVLGFVLGGIAGAVLGVGLGAVAVAVTGNPPGDGDAGDELAQYFAGPGLIIGAFAGAYIGRWVAYRAMVRRESREDW